MQVLYKISRQSIKVLRKRDSGSQAQCSPHRRQAKSWAQLKSFPSSNRAFPPSLNSDVVQRYGRWAVTLCLSVLMMVEHIDIIRWSCLRMMVMMFSLAWRSVKTRTSQSNFLLQCSDLYPTYHHKDELTCPHKRWSPLIQQVINSTVCEYARRLGENKIFISLSRFIYYEGICHDLFYRERFLPLVSNSRLRSVSVGAEGIRGHNRARHGCSG